MAYRELIGLLVFSGPERLVRRRSDSGGPISISRLRSMAISRLSATKPCRQRASRKTTTYRPVSDDLRTLPITELAPHLIAARQTSHTLLECFGAALNSEQLAVPFKENLNPPLWEFGHVAWFTDYWIARNPQRSKGTKYAATAHLPSDLAPADGLFNSATVAHETRWQLPLLGITGIHAYLRDVALRTEDCLADDLSTPKADLAGTASNREQSTAHDSSYFYRLALAHEDMHAEAFYMTAQDLGFGLTETTTPPWQKANRGSAAPAATSTPETEARNRSIPNTNTPVSRMTVTGQALALAAPSSDFYFDNEAGALSADLASFEIDTQPVSHGAFAAFIEDNGYQRAALWSPEGWAWRLKKIADGPRQVSVSNGRVFRQWFGQTLEVPEWFPMIHVCLYEAAGEHMSGRPTSVPAFRETATDHGLDRPELEHAHSGPAYRSGPARDLRLHLRSVANNPRRPSG
jgi:gamma-glutamyl hercynylcysteine S-oxide synthase